VPGSLVFVGSKGPIPLDDWTRWWASVPGTNWRHPYGPDTLDGRDLHPVVDVGYEDAVAYAAWIGKCCRPSPDGSRPPVAGWTALPTAGAGTSCLKGRIMANTWHARFPCGNLRPHGFDRTLQVKRFAPNGYGLFDIAGNVWDWTTTPWAADHIMTVNAPIHACCSPGTERSASTTGELSGAVRTCAHLRTAIATDTRVDKVMPYAAQPAISDFAT
jgi:formylglycine-generating enzyme